MTHDNPKLALLTGAAGVLGSETARALTADGFRVIMVDLNRKRLEALAQEIGRGAYPLALDVADPQKIAKACAKIRQEFGQVSVLVNNAGITRDGLIMRMKEEDWDAVISVNLKSAFNCIKAVSKIMVKQRAGRIINLASVVGVMGNPGQANYVASKAGMIGLTKTVAKELGARGITVNAVAPGFIETDMTAVLSDKAKEAMLGMIPLQRAGTPQDVADAITFLASDQARFYCGDIISPNGGALMR